MQRFLSFRREYKGEFVTREGWIRLLPASATEPEATYSHILVFFLVDLHHRLTLSGSSN